MPASEDHRFGLVVAFGAIVGSGSSLAETASLEKPMLSAAGSEMPEIGPPKVESSVAAPAA